MDSIYENFDFIRSTIASDENCSPHKDDFVQSNLHCIQDNFTEGQEKESEVHPPKWTKVLLIAVAVCLIFALGGLCILGILYFSVSVQLSSQQTNGTMMARELEELTDNYTRVREHLHINKMLARELTDNYTNYKEQFEALHIQHEETLRKLNRLNPSTGCARCAVHWIHSEGKCYYFSTDEMNWSQSRDHCVSLGGHLVIINSRAEQDFLSSKVKESHWIGLNDLDTEGHWVWVNNQPLTDSITFWMKRENEPSEPDNWTKEDPAGEDCASLGHPVRENAFWKDAFCFEKKRWVCESAAAG